MWIQKNIKSSLCLALALMLSMACTKKEEPHSQVSIGIPISAQSSKSALTALGTINLEHIVLNIHSAGGSLLKEVTWDRSCHCPSNYTNPVPTTFDFDLPAGNGYVAQLLFVYQDDTTRQMSIKYGGASFNLASNSQLDLPITVQGTGGGGNGTFSTISGRYYRADGSKPSGLLTVQFKSPVSGRPNMVIMKDDMLAGWFRVFAVDGFEFAYVLEPQKEVLFNSIRLVGDALYINGNLNAYNSTLMQAKLPIHKRKIEFGDGSVSWNTQEPRNIIAGFFGPGAPAANVICYSPAATEISGLYQIDQATKLQWKTAYDAAHASRVAGGEPSTHASCVLANNANLYLDHLDFKGTFLTGGADRVLGFDGPFKVKAVGSWIESMQVTYQNVGTPGIKLSWELLPDVSSVLAGFTIYSKSGSGGGGGGGSEDIPCNQRATAKGMTAVADITNSAQTNYLIAGASATTSMEYMVCPFISVASQQTYLLSGVSGNYFANFVANNHFGDGAQGAVTVSGNISNFSTNTTLLGGSNKLSANRRLTNIAADGKTVTVHAAVTSYDYAVGDEVMWLVMAANHSGTNSCGASDLSAGRYGFAKVVSVSSLTIGLDARVSWDSDLTTLNTRLATPYTGWKSDTSFCVIQLIRVPNFASLTFSAASTVTAPPFDYTAGTGGVIVLRTQSLDVGTSAVVFSAEGMGLAGGAATAYSYGNRGIGTTGQLGTSAGPGSGASGGSGGASSGDGGDGMSATGLKGLKQQCGGVPCDAWDHKVIVLGAGGSGGGGGAGGSGGGLVMIFAKELKGTGSLALNSNGAAGSGATSAGGGGAGGVSYLVSNFKSLSTITFSAGGGAGGTGSFGGGGGGGGQVQHNYCANPATLSSANVPGGVNGTSAQVGATGNALSVYKPDLCNY